MTFWLAFGAGLFIGAFLGVLAMCILIVAKEREG